MQQLVAFMTIAILFGPLNERCDALTCPRCTEEYKTRNCRPKVCSYGVTHDICGCCQACAKGEGEDCGGIWNYHGICSTDYNLKCDAADAPQGWQKGGKCVKDDDPRIEQPNYLNYYN